MTVFTSCSIIARTWLFPPHLACWYVYRLTGMWLVWIWLQAAAEVLPAAWVSHGSIVLDLEVQVMLMVRIAHAEKPALRVHV